MTKAITQTASGEVISLGSLTITETQNTTGYALDVAFALSSSPDVTVAACTRASSGAQPWRVAYPPGVGSGAFDYPASGAFLQQLASDGYLDTAAIDLATVPDAAQPTDLWIQQPTFADVLGASAPKGIAGTLVPGVLYVNLVLAASQGAAQWEVQEWNYAFSIHAQLADLCPPPARSPPPQQPPPPIGHRPPPSQCPAGLQIQSNGTCGSQSTTNGEPTCLSGPRAGQAPPAGADASIWCSTAPPPVSPGVPCGSPDACPAVLTCGAGIACPLLPPP